MFLFYVFIFYYLGFTFLDQIVVNLFVITIFLTILIKKKRYKLLLICIVIFTFSLVYKCYLRYNPFYFDVGMVVSSKDNYFIFNTLSGNYYVYFKEHNFEVGDILKISGDIKNYGFTTYESQFDFNKYLVSNDVYYQIQNFNIKPIFYSLIRIKVIINNLLNKYDGEVNSLIGLLLFNKGEYEYSSLIYKNNLSYYMILSSFHIYFFTDLIRKLLNIKLSKKNSEKIVILLVLLIVFFSNYKISIIRLLLFQIINYLNHNYLKKKISRIEVISLVFLIIGIIFPISLSKENIAYSYFLYLLLYLGGESGKILKRGKKVFFPLLVNSYIIILNLYFNQYFSILSLPFGILFGPYILVFYILVVISLIIPIDKVIRLLSQGIIRIVDFFDLINVKFYSSSFNLICLIISIGLILLTLYFIESGRIKKVFYCACTFIFIVFSSCLPIQNLYIQSVYFINVGQGDSILFKDKNTNILIDTGGSLYNNLANETLIPFFKKHKVRQIDYLFISHNDYDHCGASEELIKNYRVNQVINYHFSKIEIGDLIIQDLNQYSFLWSDDNNKSQVLYVNFKNKDFLLMGDASVEIEKSIIKDHPSLNVDYLKVGHHGSSTSTCEEFICTYLPKVAIISVGKNNIYHHPSDKVIRILNKYQVKIYRTDEMGTIKI